MIKIIFGMLLAIILLGIGIWSLRNTAPKKEIFSFAEKEN